MKENKEARIIEIRSQIDALQSELDMLLVQTMIDMQELTKNPDAKKALEEYSKTGSSSLDKSYYVEQAKELAQLLTTLTGKTADELFNKGGFQKFIKKHEKKLVTVGGATALGIVGTSFGIAGFGTAIAATPVFALIGAVVAFRDGDKILKVGSKIKAQAKGAYSKIIKR